ncbi:hypothetical protein OG292_19195 [Streptomyces sp. NBC_01511]|uniref:hypothetical protein n=1 Tax=Streptomyces sp. NBC_01511 TaxID=2903889 RepID=UPI0038702375
MTWLNIILSAPGWLACLLIPLDRISERRFRRRYEQRWGEPPGDRARRRAVKDGEVCTRYQPPAAPESSGLCGRCGMTDYKHRRTTRA